MAERRRKRKLCLFYKMYHGLAPSYLIDLLPENVGSKSSYTLRNSDNIQLPFTRIKHSYESFLPSSVRMWNNLPLEDRKCTSISKFKTSLKLNNDTAPLYFSSGKRNLNIIHTKLRYRSSQLNYDLFRIGLRDEPYCVCGHLCENSLHYFFECKMYYQQRQELMNKLDKIVMHRCILDINLVLNGNADLTHIENETIFTSVQQYIQQTKRFKTAV